METESPMDAGAVREALAVLQQKQVQTVQGLSRLEALGTASLNIVADAGY